MLTCLLYSWLIREVAVLEMVSEKNLSFHVFLYMYRPHLGLKKLVSSLPCVLL